MNKEKEPKSRTKVGWGSARPGANETNIIARWQLQDVGHAQNQREREELLRRVRARLATGYYEGKEVMDQTATKLMQTGLLDDVI